MYSDYGPPPQILQNPPYLPSSPNPHLFCLLLENKQVFCIFKAGPHHIAQGALEFKLPLLQ